MPAQENGVTWELFTRAKPRKSTKGPCSSSNTSEEPYVFSSFAPRKVIVFPLQHEEGGVGMAQTIEGILHGKDGEIWSIAPDATVYQAIEMMAAHDVGALLVMLDRRLVGIISERDYARKVILQGLSSRELPVSEIMTGSLITVTPGHTVDDCMRLMTDHHVRHLPVVDGGRVAGVISIGDLVRAIISDQAHTIDQLHTYIGAKYPA